MLLARPARVACARRRRTGCAAGSAGFAADRRAARRRRVLSASAMQASRLSAAHASTWIMMSSGTANANTPVLAYDHDLLVH